MKLNQVIAIVNGYKNEAQKKYIEITRKIQNENLLTGISRTYRPKDEDGDQLPSETNKIQYTAQEAIDEGCKIWSKLWDLVASQELTNCSAKADVTVDNEFIVKNIPATTLIFLEKQLNEIRSFVTLIPTLDPAEDWEYEDTIGAYVSPAFEKTRSKKIPKNHIKYDATPEHPAQVEVYHEDVIIGTWTTRKFSGAMSVVNKNNILERISKLIDSVKMAREQANMEETQELNISKNLLSYIFKGTV